MVNSEREMSGCEGILRMGVLFTALLMGCTGAGGPLEIEVRTEDAGEVSGRRTGVDVKDSTNGSDLLVPEVDSTGGSDIVVPDVQEILDLAPVPDLDAQDVSHDAGCEPICDGIECGDDGCGDSCGTCETDSVCVAGICDECPVGKKLSGAIFGNEVEPVEFDSVSVEITHKRDVDEWEDGCLAHLVFEFKRGEGCTLSVVSGDTYDLQGRLNIEEVTFHADSMCPGFSDDEEGQYHLQDGLEDSYIQVIPTFVPGSDASQSCVAIECAIHLLPGTLSEGAEGKEMVLLDTVLEVSGAFLSQGDYEADCPCLPSCDDLLCGDAGCGFSCGKCVCGETCDDGACVFHACDGKDCGDDGCEGNCGQCSCGELCEDHLCIFHGCDGKECGDDGCQGDCGECLCGEECLAGFCVGGPCSGKQCGPDDCGGSCGTCPEGIDCLPAGQCETSCLLACDGASCGSDGCGGWCGQCAEDDICTDAGACVGECAPNCDGSECGGNGCGGSCGNCPVDEYCHAGTCSADCASDCLAKTCGDDGCGGSCGECNESVLCVAAGICGGSCAQCGSQPECTHITFASGTLADWAIDEAQLTPHFWESMPLVGDYMLLLATFDDLKSSAVLPNCLPADEYGVGVRWQFYSEEFKEWCGSTYQDSLAINVNSGNEIVTLGEYTVDGLCPPAECVGCGANYAGLYSTEAVFDQGDVWKTPWVETWSKLSLDGPSPVQFELAFALQEDSGWLYHTAVLVDEVRLVPCEQICDFLQCGPNPCGDPCGECGEGEKCMSGSCCQPNCEGKVCGDDGCGGSCGACDALMECGIAGQCKCKFEECSDGCCLTGHVCAQVTGNCCAVECGGKDCGPDGCGGSCGQCSALEQCLAGTCQCDFEMCNGECCDAAEGCSLITGDCCAPSCFGKECGDDGCGTSCGGCDDAILCTADVCVDGMCNHEDLCCESAADCDDGDDICTEEQCVEGNCLYAGTGVPGCCTVPLFSDDFSTDKGWAYGTEWERGLATSSSGQSQGSPDPESDHTKTDDNYLAGVVIGGNAEKEIHDFYYLVSPVVDTSEAAKPTLVFWRWLNSDYASYMVNRVEVFDGSSWHVAWETGGAPGVQDDSWTKQQFDLTEFSDPGLRVRFGFQIGSAGVFTMSGWNLDDVLIVDNGIGTDQCCNAAGDCEWQGKDCVQGACQ